MNVYALHNNFKKNVWRSTHPFDASLQENNNGWTVGISSQHSTLVEPVQHSHMQNNWHSAAISSSETPSRRSQLNASSPARLLASRQINIRQKQPDGRKAMSSYSSNLAASLWTTDVTANLSWNATQWMVDTGYIMSSKCSVKRRPPAPYTWLTAAATVGACRPIV